MWAFAPPRPRWLNGDAIENMLELSLAVIALNKYWMLYNICAKLC